MSQNHQVFSQAILEIKAAPELVFDWATDPAKMPQFFRGYKGIPGIKKVEIEGREIQAGTLRKVYNTDNSVIDEEIIDFTRPHQHSYRLISGFKPPFSWLVTTGGGTWTFSNSDQGTIVDWQFYFQLRSIVAYPIMTKLILPQFQKAQQLCLLQIKQMIESNIQNSQDAIANNPFP